MMTQRGPLVRAHCKANICGMSVGTNHHRNPSLMRTETNKNIVLEWPILRRRSDDDVNQWTSLNAPQTTNTISRSQEMFANGCRTHQLNWMVSSSSMWELTAHELTAVLMQKKSELHPTNTTQHKQNTPTYHSLGMGAPGSINSTNHCKFIIKNLLLSHRLSFEPSFLCSRASSHAKKRFNDCSLDFFSAKFSPIK